jgi:hypothetical protein
MGTMADLRQQPRAAAITRKPISCHSGVKENNETTRASMKSLTAAGRSIMGTPVNWTLVPE